MAQHRPHYKSALSEPRKRKSVVKPPKKKVNQNLSRDEQRYIDNKKKTQRRNIKKNLALCLLAIVFICVGIVLVFSLFFKTNTISVKGETIYTPEMISKNCGVELGTNLFRINEEEVSQKLSKSLPYIKKVTLERKLPDTLIINVQSTKEVAAVSLNSVFVLIDETGKVLDKDASVLNEGVALVKKVKLTEAVEGEQVAFTNSAKVESLITLLRAIKESKLDLLTEIELKNINDIKIVYDDRITLEVGSLTNIETKLARGVAALEKENEINSYSHGTLDLKIEPYAYFKAATEETDKKENTKKQQK